MNIYFACSITGGREFQPVYQAMALALVEAGHVVPTAHLAEPGVTSEAALSPRLVYERDTAWIRDCEVLIAEVSIPSHGVGYEIAYALQQGKPVLCLYQQGRPLSKMISGNPESSLEVLAYEDTGQALEMVWDFLARYL